MAEIRKESADVEGAHDKDFYFQEEGHVENDNDDHEFAAKSDETSSISYKLVSYEEFDDDHEFAGNSDEISSSSDKPASHEGSSP